MSKSYKYESVFVQVAFQFCGHADEYFVANAREAALFYAQTRFGHGGHMLRRYKEGELVEERALSSSHSVVGYYLLWLWHWHRELCRFARTRKGTLAIFTHPLGGLGMALRGKVRHLFWQWDYFPGGGRTERLFNAAARHCVKHCEYRPLTGAIGRAMGVPDAKVVMLGVSLPTRFAATDSDRLLMVGQLRHGQGVEDVLDFIAANPKYRLSLMGKAAGIFGDEIRRRIMVARMEERVYFPDKFVSEAELREEAAKCFAALALYDTSPSNLTHFADPGKVKSSIEMGLPVIMTRISEIAPFVERFKAGEVIESLDELPDAVGRVHANPAAYVQGAKDFAEFFQYDGYYRNNL